MNRNRRRSKRFPLLLVAIIFLSSFAILSIIHHVSQTQSSADEPPTAPATVSVSAATGAGRVKAGLPLLSRNAILFNPDSGEIYYAKSADEKAYPASLTKVMTALVAIEQISDLDMPVTLEYDDYAGLYEQNAAMSGFAMGETVTARDLLYATLLPSGAEAACALARAAAGSQQNCVDMMNERARSLGMKNTHFTNVTGLHDPDHYTTVYDLSLLLSQALKGETFTTVFTTFSYVTTATEQHPQGMTLTSTLTPRIQQLHRSADPIVGAKTGYTEEAQLCLASIGEHDGVRRAVITIGAEGDGDSEPTHLEDAYLLYDKSLPHESN